jgi:hypothetical protein
MISRERRWIANDGGEVGSPTDAQGEILRYLAGELTSPITILATPKASIVYI